MEATQILAQEQQMYVGNFLNEIQDDSQKTTGEDKLIWGELCKEITHVTE